MQKSTLPQGVKTLMSWADKETLTFDNPVQRAGSQWNLLQKSLLIHSMLANYPVPAVYLLKYKDELYQAETIRNFADLMLMIVKGLIAENTMGEITLFDD